MVNYMHNVFGFLGGSDGDFFKYAKIQSTTAYFNDTGAYSDSRPLYYKGEEPCEITFKLINNRTILVQEKNTCGVYAGTNNYWHGEYKKFDDDKILRDLMEWSSRKY